ncbi:hypothetical protein [Stenotrophomonas sp. GD03657]|jgi:hypothetical protein|uniref:hypothetical protein n=1 Tax=Stenotrophomonas sp. GD03657 TaxID=2975363 RepID=UPI00244C4075|nr:hypothetical protein [Stenotrophomonas sp. GD03657]MDH2154325.1 hypothetical protein [Stenotrophomonas sp. GD03657]
MARIIQGGAAMFDAVHYGRQNQEVVNFLSRQFEAASHHLTEAGRAFYERAQSTFENLNTDYATRLLRAAGRAIEGLYMPDRIQPLTTIGGLQHAPPAMWRWVMAEPSLRELWQANRVEGYEGYVDLDPGRVGEWHYDHQRATNGIVTFFDEPTEEDVHWQAPTYLGALLPDDRELDFGEQVDIMETWRAVRRFTEAGGEDPTSRYNAEMG